MTARAIPHIRRIHASAIRFHLVGPPDTVSNIRPVVYDDDLPNQRADLTHPYSLREFKGDTREYQWKMQRQQLDAYNHTFWSNSNSRFEAAKNALLESLPDSCTEEDREFALSEFYRRWIVQETARQQEYDAEWRKQNWSSLLLAIRLSYEKSMARISRLFSSS
ncbi:uncharacterized protein FIBRA_04512 [Fibroporia radiculosa]|uniref:Apoptogenic protein 1, mitochondrial n=1 Tax=Fibroporia radiculosa TaxID=599839 RepID=J4H301_9APHY|nr:uncharacterized protein FIBRA_04512 [Fibroporia radiculosa]CCM02414.1 predicted protein [Fibroporia radiculosa]